MMFITSRCEKIPAIEALDMCRAVPWSVVELAKCQQFLALSLVQFPPKVHVRQNAQSPLEFKL
jgi:hypothetical protein